MFYLSQLGKLQSWIPNIKGCKMVREQFFEANKDKLYKGTGRATVMDGNGNIVQLTRAVYSTEPYSDILCNHWEKA